MVVILRVAAHVSTTRGPSAWSNTRSCVGYCEVKGLSRLVILDDFDRRAKPASMRPLPSSIRSQRPVAAAAPTAHLCAYARQTPAWTGPGVAYGRVGAAKAAEAKRPFLRVLGPARRLRRRFSVRASVQREADPFFELFSRGFFLGAIQILVGSHCEIDRFDLGSVLDQAIKGELTALSATSRPSATYVCGPTEKRIGPLLSLRLFFFGFYYGGLVPMPSTP